MKIKINNRGELTQTVLIGIIILLVSAAIILLFLKAFPFNETIDREACRLSVQARSNALVKGEIGAEAIPLKCKTEDITITTNNEEIIKKDISDAMYNCWWELGEGKKDFFSQDSWFNFLSQGEESTKACIICSTIKFDKGAQNKQIDLVSYLSNTKIPLKNITYLQYFSDSNEAKLPPGMSVPKIDTNKQYFITFTGVRKSSWTKTIFSTITTTISGTAVGLIGGCIIGAVGGPIGCGLGAAGGAIGGLITGAISASVGAIENHIASATYCNNYVYGDKEESGCFVMTLAEMNTANLKQQCRNIESIP